MQSEKDEASWWWLDRHAGCLPDRFGSGDNEWEFLEWKKRKGTRFQYAITNTTAVTAATRRRRRRPTYKGFIHYIGPSSEAEEEEEGRMRVDRPSNPFGGEKPRETNKFNPAPEPQIADNVRGDEESVCSHLFLWQYGEFIAVQRSVGSIQGGRT